MKHRHQISQQIIATGLIPLFYHSDPKTAIEIIKACYKGGSKAVEFTARGSNAIEVFTAIRKYCNLNLPDMLIGIGSITDAAAASLYMQLGADFIVTPVLRQDIAKVCNRRKILWMPGCASLTEITAAEELGCEIIKLFPGSQYGSQFVKAIKGPQPWTQIMPTGGVTTEQQDLENWFNAGVCCVGMGSNLICKEPNGNYNFKAISNSIQATIKTIKDLRSK
ncbi:2-keto-3-deoxy-6-phosphogluconate aldolase [Galbibacter orientalis DSM 19592]|uniref:2-keto-3-deoxy-6-phosphogluconate aldolase n=1 Tax=Galbibacter orientalis DSM 19592 TaxID=926559 RepID=I3CAU2_9FLAO|nr:bifunctional 4-hydroxy-2-oxoglutarate aldolase/2-dehydro-3-deoxy-phosphogluconate aldolase [Galbibacter orientalis]EIJ40735.1 2-keto-3-deoxy-6-phosphogluconate aldolase [Galbibacter orientalis DSM 19592]